MSSQAQTNRFWLYFLVFCIFFNTCSLPNRSEVKNIVRDACVSQVE
jgi:hypothetical protein